MTSRAHRKYPSPDSAAKARTAKSAYFSVIKHAKKHYWKSFLSGAKHQSVSKAKRLALGCAPTRFSSLPGAVTSKDTRNTLLEHCFPALNELSQNSIHPVFNECPPVTKEEVSCLLGRSSPSSASSPNSMPYVVWKLLHKMFPCILQSLTSPLVERGYHAVSLRKGEGVVLDKPGKPSYDTPTSYLLIVLLEILSKIVERLISNRLSAQAPELGLIHPNQCGSLPGVSTFHAAISLSHEVVIAQKLRLKASSLFLDIKGSFNNIKPTQLTGQLREKGVSLLP